MEDERGEAVRATSVISPCLRGVRVVVSGVLTQKQAELLREQARRIYVAAMDDQPRFVEFVRAGAEGVGR